MGEGVLERSAKPPDRGRGSWQRDFRPSSACSCAGGKRLHQGEVGAEKEERGGGDEYPLYCQRAD